MDERASEDLRIPRMTIREWDIIRHAVCVAWGEGLLGGIIRYGGEEVYGDDATRSELKVLAQKVGLPDSHSIFTALG